VGVWIYTRALFWAGVILVLLLWLGAGLWYQLLYRLKTDLRFARRMKAPQYARQGLTEARRHLDQGAAKEFYDTLFKTMQQYLGNRFHLASGTVEFETIQNIAAEKPQAGTILPKVKKVFAACELVRYASVSGERQEMLAVYEEAEEAIDLIERNWR